jgi:hypothetical protein
MSNNTKIFSEAIAEAKAIRETAMANAKLALEEAFTPRIKEMMSSKLEALAEEDEMEEGYNKEMEEGNMENMDEISLEELLSELEGLEEGEDLEEGKEEMEENINEAEAEDEVGEITVDELKDIIRDVLADVMGGGEEEMEMDDEMEAEEEIEDEEISLDEILAEIASLEEGDEEMEEGLKDMAKKVGDTVKANVGPGGKLDQFIDKTGDKMRKAGLNSPYGGQKVFEDDQLDEKGGSTMREPSSSAAAGADQIVNMIKSAIKKSPAMASKIMKALEDAGAAAGSAMRAESQDLEEAMDTIATLRSELNEVNLLNAKLLYVNKLFKAKTLNESQKVKVINAFDRAETVKEAKNIYETLNESLSTAKKSQLKENLSFASKAVGVADKTVIVESNDFIARMQKLAGIK